MAEQNRGSELNKRPAVITIVCIFSFIGFAMIFVSLLRPAIRGLLIQRYGMIIMFLTLLTLIFGISGIIGYWRMSRWGVYLYSIMVIISLGGGMMLGIQTGPMAYVMPFVIIGIGLAYFKQMK